MLRDIMFSFSPSLSTCLTLRASGLLGGVGGVVKLLDQHISQDPSIPPKAKAWLEKVS